MLNISIKTIPHADQRYDTCGDYQNNGKQDIITVSQLGDWRQELLVALHELIELALTRQQGISLEKIDEFDLAYQGADPGAHPDCPYFHEHLFATNVERLVAHELGVDWEEYEKTIAKL